MAAKGNKPKTKAAIKTVQKKKKVANGQDSDESDDFLPTKAAAKPKVPAKPKNPGKVSPAKRPVCVVISGQTRRWADR